jgi:predicted acyltransferase
MTIVPPIAPAPKPRLASLDQFRGYTVAGMFLVNFLGHYYAAPFVCRHHNTYCSYADTIMPQFFFAVGFSMRLSFGRRVMQQGKLAAYGHMIKRLIGLALVAIFITYRAEPPWPKDAKHTWDTLVQIGAWNVVWPHAIKNTWFQTLMHIAVTSLWILPVIRLGAIWRIFYLLLSAILHFGLSAIFNYQWVNGIPPFEAGGTGIDGGPLGFLSWTIPTMVGTLACDVALSTATSGGGKFFRLLTWGVVLMALGYGASCLTRMYDVLPRNVNTRNLQFSRTAVIPSQAQVERWLDSLKQRDWSKVLAEPPLVPPPHSQEEVTDPKKKEDGELSEDKSFNYREQNYWMMSQRSGSISYLTFAAGLSLVIYGLFFVLADMIGIKIGIFRTLGVNALVGYILHDLTEEAVNRFLPRNSPPYAMWAGFAVFFFVTWLFLRSLEKQKIYVKL